MSTIHLPRERWRYLANTGVWPKRALFDPYAWIENFTDTERPYALRLLEGFTYYPQELLQQMFRSTFLTLSQTVVLDKSSRLAAQSQWEEFFNSLLVVRVTGEIPSDADSGFAFLRLARNILNFDESQIVSPEKAIELLARGGNHNILFVDDFVGSGNQFCDTWERVYEIQGYRFSFNSVAIGSQQTKFFYCPLICTEYGKIRIASRCPQVNIVPAHFFSTKQSAISNDSEIWRDDMRTEGPEFVEQASLRAGLVDKNGAEGCWRGFHKLGLAVSFGHYWPDATLPLFSSSENGWKPLLREGVV